MPLRLHLFAICHLLLIIMLLPAASPAHGAGDFKFSEHENDTDPEAQARKARLQAQLDTPCKARLKQQKIMVLLAENRNGIIHANQGHYNLHVNAINDRLKALGLKTYTQEQIRAQVAQAEIDAHFKNDPDAALGAAKRLAANYVLRGVIDTRVAANRVANLNQININMAFSLAGANGKQISQAEANNASYAGNDITGMALTLVRENADEVVAKLYADYCSQGKKP